MTDQPGAVAPYPGSTVSGEVLSPSRIASAQDSLGHDFFNVIRHLIHHTGGYRNEGDQTDHLAAVSRYENAVAGGHFTGEDDVAPREDVSQRTPPPGSTPQPVAPAAPQLDYAQLARAIVAVQQENAKAAESQPASQE